MSSPQLSCLKLLDVCLMFPPSPFPNIQYQLAEEAENPLIHFTWRISKLSLCLAFFFLMWTLYFKDMGRKWFCWITLHSLLFCHKSPQRGKGSIAKGGIWPGAGTREALKGASLSLRSLVSKWNISSEVCPKVFPSSAILRCPVIRLSEK